MKNKQTTIRDIAEEAGVSPMTVSRALRGDSHVDPNTAARIREVADRLDYHRNPLVSTVMSTMRGAKKPLCNPIIAFLSANNTLAHPEQRLASQLYLEGARKRASEFGVEVEEYVIEPTKEDAGKLSGILYARNIRGLLIGPLWLSFADLSLDWKEYASGAISIHLVEPDLDRCGGDPVQAVNLAIDNLKRLGYNRIGFAVSPFHVGLSHHRSRAMYLDYQCDLPTAQAVPLIDDWSFQGVAKWLEKGQPDAIIGHGDEMLSWLNALGVRVPQDVGYVDINMFEGTKVPFAGVVYDYRSIGAAAADMVINNLLRSDFGLPEHPIHSYIQGYWKDGSTVLPQSPSVAAKKGRIGAKAQRKDLPATGSEAFYPLARTASGSQRQSIDLSGLATHSYRTGKDISNWEEGLGLPLEPGRREINGVPFLLINEKDNKGKGFVLLQNQASIMIPVGKTCEAVFFLLAAGFISSHGPLAEIVYRWADGQEETQPLVAYFTPPPDTDSDEKDQWVLESGVQDWWPTFPHFYNESAKAHRLGEDDQNPVEWRYLYTLQWVNSRPRQVLRSITIRHLPMNESKLAVFSATMMQPS